MATRVQRAILLMASFTVWDQLEWTGYQMPLILNYLLSFSILAALHDITTLFLSLGVAVNKAANAGLVLVVSRARPAPYDEPGQPAREMQSILFMGAFYVVYLAWWPRAFDPVSALSLVLATAWAWVALDVGGHYFTSQLVGGAFVGTVLGTAWGLFFHACLLPHAPPWVRWWNARVPAALAVTHAYHYHPGRHCAEPGCSGYTVCESGHADPGLGFGHLASTLLRLLLIAVIHS